MVKTGIIPLILVELVLIAIYLLSNHLISSENMKYIYTKVNEELVISSKREMNIIREKILSISDLTNLYRNETTRVLNSKTVPDDVEKDNLVLSDNGVLYSKQDLGGSASFYSSYTSKNNQDMNKVYKLSQLDPLMKQIKDNNELVAAIYFNSWDSYNRIYPWFSTIDQYPADMNIPEFNFYYLADKKYDPSRGVVWTDVYIDPAGQGWMASAIAPVYNHDFLEGVVGLDITVSTIVGSIQSLTIPWNGYAVLVSSDGNIMALPPQGESDFGVKELTDYTYKKAITEESFKPEVFNLYRRSDTTALSTDLRKFDVGLSKIVLNNENKLISWSTIPETKWKLLLIVDENKMYSASKILEDKYQRVGYILIVGLIAFYTLFFFYIWYSSKKMSDLISQPLAKIQNMLYKVGIGEFIVSHDDYKLKEINETANSIIEMGERLDKLTGELKSAKIDAENANIAKSQFISNISHEIRTPLNSILGLSQILLENNLERDQKEGLIKINKSGNHLLALVNNVLDLSKIDASKLEIESIPFAVSSVAQDVYDIFSYNAKEKGLKLTVNYDQNIPPVIGDPLRIKQILINFVGNAVKFTMNGNIVVNVELLSEFDSSVSVRFSVHDSGIGLSPQEQINIFDSFQQADSSTTRKFGGSGLGLAICKRFAQLMGGSVGVESTKGVGSTFWFTLELKVDRSGTVFAADNADVQKEVSSSGETSETKVTGPAIGIDEFEAKLDRLTSLLEDNDLEAEHYFSMEKDYFDAEFPELSEQLATYVASYEYGEALEVAKTIKALLESKKN